LILTDFRWVEISAEERLMRSSASEEMAIVGMQAREARELALAAALAAHGPGSVRLPLAIVAGRYSLQRPALGAVRECIEVMRATRRTLPATCVVLASTADLDGPEKPPTELEERRRVPPAALRGGT
jgi:hypothetical protein